MDEQQPVQNSTPVDTPPASSPKREVEVRCFTRWRDLRAELDKLSNEKQWAFRGQEKAEWGLTHTLYRQLKNRGIKPESWEEQEERIIRIFSRKAHLFLPALPGNFLEWLALMQHHGAPTRLLDFTWSPYVAAFFALDNATGDEDAAIWAVNNLLVNVHRDPALSTRTKMFPSPPPTLEQDPCFIHCRKSGKRTACILNPFVMNQRLIAQSGTFLVPTVLDTPLDELLLECHQATCALLKLQIRTSEVRQEAMWDLYQMNINQATLFPGLDGLARSMALELEVRYRQKVPSL
jgi:hypothetical protein